jgi:hypothetical protein
MVDNGTRNVAGREGSIGINQGAFYTADATCSSPDYEVTVTGADIEDGTNYTILAVRVQDANNLYALEYSGGEFSPWKKVSGSWTELGNSVTEPTTNGDVVKLRAEGSQISAYINEIRYLSVPDTSITAA